MEASANFQELLQQQTEQVEMVQAKKESDRAEKIGEMLIDHLTNNKGELLAKVHESIGFKEVYDYKGNQQRRFRLERKCEQVHNQYHSDTHLYQKLYYAKELTHDDETKLRQAFWDQNNAYQTQSNIAKGALLLAYVPLTYRMSAVVKPTTLLMMTGAYYFGLYKGMIEPQLVNRMQASLNFAAEPFATKYCIE